MRTRQTQSRLRIAFVITGILFLSGCGGGITQPLSYQSNAPNPVPTITGVSPNSAIANQGFTLTISGTNFIATSLVSINGTIVGSGTDVGSTQLTVSVPAGVVSAGTAAVTVTNPAPGGTSNSAIVTVTNP